MRANRSSRLAEFLVEDVDDVALYRVERRIHNTLGERRPRFGAKAPAVAWSVALAGAVALALVFWSGAGNDASQGAAADHTDMTRANTVSKHEAAQTHALGADPLSFADGRLIKPGLLELESDGTQFADGVTLTAIDTPRVEVLQNDATQTRIGLASGQLSLEIPPGTGRTWTVSTRGFFVRVIGTKFRVTQSDHESGVSVERGIVEVVEKNGTQHVLKAGDTWHADRSEHPRETSKTPIRPSPLAPYDRTKLGTSASGAIDVEPPTSVQEREANPSFADVDRARDEGRIDDAIRILEQLSESPGTRERALAYFGLGKIEHERGKLRSALSSLYRAHGLVSEGPLAEAIRGRIEDVQAQLQQRAP